MNTNSIDNLIKTNPLLLDAKDDNVHKVGNYYLPYSTGFEIECRMLPNFSRNSFVTIPGIITADVNSSNEQRFRIPNGIKGLQVLQRVSIAMVEQAELNTNSGIHYHIDCSEMFDLIDNDVIANNAEWMLKELDSWQYAGNYNQRRFSPTMGAYWIRLQPSFKTIEIRIGEMTFNYELLFKRITHANAIIRRFKTILQNVSILYKDDYTDVPNKRIIKI